MIFTRTRLSLFFVIILIAAISYSCSPTSPESLASELKEESEEPSFEICDQPPELAIFDLQAAAVMQVLIGDGDLELLGVDGAEDLAGEYLSLDNTFCGLDAPPEVVDALDEIEALFDSGQDTEAQGLLESLLDEIEKEEYSLAAPTKKAAPENQQGRANTRRKVRAYLTVTARAQYWGNTDLADRSLDAALHTYSTWAAGAIEGATISEALTIAAEAQLLGLVNLGDEAIQHASNLAEQAYLAELAAFAPCTASLQEARKLLRAGALGQLLGVEIDTDELMDKINQWLDIQRRREAGEEIVGCEAWQVNLVIDTVWESGSHNITWEGRFIVKEDNTLEGQGQGVLSTHVEVLCVNVMSGEEYMSTTDVTGSFQFDIQGSRQDQNGEPVFKFLFPAETTYSGVDTCNPFDAETYLPKAIIEDITVYGGVDNYDPATDKIFMVLPAVNGSQEKYETLIGPVVVTLTKLDGEN